MCEKILFPAMRRSAILALKRKHPKRRSASIGVMRAPFFSASSIFRFWDDAFFIWFSSREVDLPTPVGFFDFRKQIYNVVGLPEIILNIVVLGGDAELYKLVFKSARLLEKKMNFSFNFHLFFLLVLKSVPAVMALRVEARRFTRLCRL